MGNPFINEDDVTNRIVELLRGKKFIRNLILQWLFPEITIEILNTIEDWHIITRTGEEDGSRPDIRIQNDKCYLLIENKIFERTPLTYSGDIRQSDRYTLLVRNSESEFCRGIFLVPKGYSHETEIKTDIRTVHHATEIMDIKYWNNFLNYLEELEIESLNMDIFYMRDAIYNAKREVEEKNEAKELLTSPDSMNPVLNLTSDIMLLFTNFLEEKKFEYDKVFFNDDIYSKESFKFIGYKFWFNKNDKTYESAILLNILGNLPDNSYSISFAFNDKDYEESDELYPAKCGKGRTSKIYFPIYSNDNELYPFMDIDNFEDKVICFRRIANSIFKKIYKQLI